MAIYPFSRIRWIGALTLMLSCAAFGQTNPSDGRGALLRCDPWTVIKSIDGRPSRVKALQGGAFTDCEISLSAGPHLLKVCYEARGLQQTGTVNVIRLYRCASDQEIRLDAVADRIYRIRFSAEPELTARIEDVTSAESNLPASPNANTSRRIPKAESASTVLVRVIGNGIPAFAPGTTQNLWFKVSRLQQALHGAKGMRPEADGYFSAEVSNGDTIAIRQVIRNGLSSFVCDTEVPVYEDLPAGRVLYLGDYHFELLSDGMRFAVTNDEEAARSFLGKQHPNLAERLETARFRPLRVPEPCLLLPVNNRLRQAPAKEISPDAASAN